jgi:hypothetical protein
MNGDIDVTLPADTKASVRMKSQQGDIYSDFDVVLKAAPQKPAEEAEKTGKGKYRISFDRFLTGAINGGGILQPSTAHLHPQRNKVRPGTLRAGLR